MDGLHIALLVLLGLSLIGNAFLYYRWHSYRSKPAGGHSHTGMMPKVDRDQILRDRQRLKDDG
jgi:hypothetical protein